ncbi:MAG TPA: tandem-95 repeat protein, partial [Ohtaekwangia sp.]|nr:tandem-95 repeat protein [Ohtaekwangia sp.]
MLKHFLTLFFLAFACVFSFGQPGKNGNYTVPAVNTVVNTYSRLTGNVAVGSSTVTVNSVAADLGGLVTGDLIMIYQAQGATIQTTDDNDYGKVLSYNNAGLYEYAYVASVAGNTITIACGVKQAYSASGHAQVIKVPQYNNLTIPSGRSIIPAKWNGSTGGIVAVHVKATLTNNGAVSAQRAGFRGGKRDNLSSSAGAGIITTYRSVSPNDGGEKGEGIAGYQTDYEAAGMGGRYSRGAPANGGGGGNGHNAAGGGGSNGNNGETWTGAGVMDPNPLYLAAWQLDPDFVSNGYSLTNSSGGGRGGYTYGANNVDAFSVPLSDPAWGGDYRDPVGGRGGRPLDSQVETRIFFGGGGGAGDGNNNASNDGGDGGGIVYIIAHTINGTGNITAEGQDGYNTTPSHNDAPGGGGGGGTIIVKAFNFTGQTLNANGGAGGNQLIGGNESEGCGGGGGGGYIAVPTGGSGTCGLTNSYTYIYGTNGTSTSASITEFPPNGGTWGATGQNDVPVSPYFIPYTLTCLIDNDGDGVHDPSSDLDDDNDGIADVLESHGGVDPSADHDGDSAPNYADPNFVPYLDGNCDGINDYFDFDLDGIPDFMDLDSDNDGITDCLEAGGNDANKDGIIDGFTDSDANGLADAVGSGLAPADMDLDGHRTFQDRDSDGDGMTDCIEAGGTDVNKDGIIDAFADTDGDGYANTVDPTTDRLALSGANASGSIPLTISDTDGDNRRNYLDLDSDNDGIPDNVEAQPTLGYVAPVNADTDGDGIANPYDATPVAIMNTDGADLPDYLDTDSDNDGISDAIEGNDSDSDGSPLPALPVAGDSDGDGLLNAYDGVAGVNSTVAGMGGTGSLSPLQDTDADGLRDWRDTDDDGDCVLTSTTGASGENTNGNTSWADDFSQGGTPKPNYLFASNTLTITGADRCGAGTVTLSASSIATGTFRWYDAAVGGTLLNTTAASSTSNFLTPSISTTATYHVEFDNTICVTPRKAVIATVISSSSAPTTSGASRCDMGSLALTATSGSAGTFRWYDAAVAGTLLQTTSSASSSEYITPSIASTTTYYVEFDNGTCTSARAAVVATITGPSTISVTDGATCGNPTAILSATSATAGTFSWYNALVDGILLHTESGVTISSFTTPSISTNTTYYVAFNDGTCTTPRVAVTATITAAITSPTVTNNTICSAGTATVLASHTSAGTFRWYSEASGGTLLQTNTGVSSSNYTTPSIAATTDYYVEFSNGNCVSPRVKVTATVVGTSVMGIDASRCGNGTVTLGAVATVPGTFHWYTASSGGTLVYTSTANSTTSSYTTGSLSASTVYYVSFTSASPVCGPTTRVPVTATISSAVTVSVTPAGICSPGTVALGASSGVTGTFRWYAASAGGTPLFTTSSATSSAFTTPFISATTDYYVEFDNGTCITSPRTPVRASVVDGTDLATTDGSRCGTGSVSLLVSSLTPGTFNWYAAETGGSPVASSGGNSTTHTYSPSVSSTTTYYVSITTASPACTGTRYPVVATVFPTAPDPTPIHGSRCGNGTVVLAASSTETGTIRWYTGGGTLVQTDHTTTLSTYTTPSLTSSRTYYAEFSNGGCTSNRVAVVATRNSGTAPAGPAVTAASRCGDGSLTLEASASSAGVFRWWSAASAGTLLQTTASATTSSFATAVLSSTTTYYVDFDNGTCLSSTRTPVTATINAFPATPTASDVSRCGPGTLSLNATSTTSGTFRWYDAATAGMLLQTTSGVTSSAYTTPILPATTIYYVEFSNGSCTSARRPVTAIVNAIPAAPVGMAGSHCGSGSVELSADATTAGTFRWYDASVGGNLLSTSTSTSSSSFTTPSISANTTYYVEFDNGTCVSARTSVLATILPTPALPGVTDGARCEAGTVNLGASSAVSGTFRWYTSSSGGALLETDVATTSSSFTTPVLTTSSVYYVEFDNGTCASSRIAVTASVHPDPVIADVTPGCSGIAGNGTITIDASVAVGTLEYSIDGTNFQASNSFTGVANGTYTVYARENSTLCSTSESNVVVQCNVPPTVSNKSATTNEDVPLSGDLLDAGDLDTEGTSLTVNTTPVVDALRGGIVIDADGTYTYTPDVNFNGTETVTFEVCDNGSPLPVACIDRVLTITVTVVNDPPVAVLDEPTTNEDTPITFSATDNDTDVDGTIDASTVDLDPNTTGIQNTFSTTEGNWAVDAAGDVTYTPTLNFNGSAPITYTVEDNGGATSSVGTITVTVTAVNDAPVAVLDEPTTNEDTPVTFSATDNDTDVDGTIDASTVDLDPNTTGIQNTFSTTEGEWSVDADGDVTYTPTLNFNGSASITYIVEDNSGAASSEGIITVTVTAVNDAPVAVLDEPTTNEDTPVIFSATDNDTAVDGTIDASTVDLDPNTTGIQNTFSTTEGEWSVDAAGDVTYTPTLNFNGSASITYTVEDNSGATSSIGTITVTVTAVNDAPVAVLDEPTTNEDTPVTFSATDNDTDVDGTIDASTVDLDPNTTGTQNTFSTTEGAWSVDAAGDVTYTPTLNFNGSASITYTV